MERGYQDFSVDKNTSLDEHLLYDKLGRERKAKTMVAVLEKHFHTPLEQMNLLNVGGSAGIIDNYFADHFSSVIGIDIDKSAIEYAKDNFQRTNLKFQIGDALNLQFPDNTFNVVICSNVYEHVPDAYKMMDEIFRVLKPGGVCYFAARNRFEWNEPHYDLPLLSAIPRPLAHVYIRLARKKSYYHELHYSYWGLKKLAQHFVIHDYTNKIVSDPDRYHTRYMLPAGSLKSALAKFITNKILWLSPSYIWLLEKPQTNDD